jgi:uncharacterized MAPEG superfamily protein
MLTDLQSIVLSALLAWLMIIAASLLRTKMWTASGLKYAFGNRHQAIDVTPVAERADRAARNMLENLVLFAVLVLAARLSGHAGRWTAVGVNLFFWARVVYWPIYLAGIPYARSLAWAVAAAGLFLIGIDALG